MFNASFILQSTSGAGNRKEMIAQIFMEDGIIKEIKIKTTEENDLKQYIVDAFTDRPFVGNPAAVCVTEAPLPEDFMQKLAAENNLSETAFLVRDGEGWRLRWFTPGTEVDLCGHATLASSFVVLNHYEKEKEAVRFFTRSGTLTVARKGKRYEMDFPVCPQREVPVTDDMEAAFGVLPVKALLGDDLVCVFASEEEIRRMTPDQTLLLKLDGRGQNVTAPGAEYDCVSRSFFPKLAIAEDPVCGSAHCQIAPYWAEAAGKKEIRAFQASKRGGELYCRLTGNGRIAISGDAVLVAVVEIVAKP